MRKLKKIFIVFSILTLLIIVFIVYFKFAVTIKPPVPSNTDVLKLKRTMVEKDFYVCKNNWLRKNKNNLWEMYIEGEPYERGVINGLLTKELVYFQEKAFVEQLKKMIPSDFYISFLKYFIAWFNRDIEKYIDKEYLLEIYGISNVASSEFDFIGPAYQRMLNYHASHDIGHALQNSNIVGCTSFGVWGDAVEDSTFLIGRNFDFNVGDDFSKNKIVCFCKPNKGFNFMYVTWGGMIGVVSGMNEMGLTVTLNAAKSEIPYSAKTPISILAREILQYAKNIKEAYKIAKEHETFVSESLLIGSASDKKAVIIEKSINSIDLFESKNNYIICSNHFQGDTFKNNKLNIESIKNSSSIYRYKRVEQLLQKYPKLNYLNVAKILRDQKGLDEKNIGMGNEKAINQLLAHHSVIFDPVKLIAWVSSNPYQLSEYDAYDLKKLFSKYAGMKNNTEISEQQYNITADTFLLSDEYKNFEKYKILKYKIIENIDCENCELINQKQIINFVSLNPEFYYTYSLVGDYFKKNNKISEAIEYYKKALNKEIPIVEERLKIEEKLKECFNE